MAKGEESIAGQLFETVGDFIRKCLFNILSVGPIPNHIAFIMDGNRRYSKKQSLEEGAGHKAGYSSLMAMLRYCFELGVKYVTIYAFSIENFKRRPDEVQTVMDLMLEKIKELIKKESIVNRYGIRVYFIGNLKLLSEPVRAAAEKVMKSSANNSKAVLLICVAYTSRDEIVHAVQESCKSKRIEIQQSNVSEHCNGVIKPAEEGEKIDKSPSLKENEAYSDFIKQAEGVKRRSSLTVDSGLTERVGVDKKQKKNPIITLVDVERRMYMAVAPDPDILIRSSGETRLSNFLLWQTGNCPLYSPTALWPEIGLRHLVWAVLNFQRHCCHIESKKEKLS